MKSSINKLFVSLLILTGSVYGNAQSIELKSGQSITPFGAIQAMYDSLYNLHTAKFKLVSRERIDGEMQQHQAEAIVQFHPKKLFLRGFDTDGVLENEILYIEGKNSDKALISPNGFPYFNLNLDPLGSTMRHHRHLTILEAGGRYLTDMLKLGMELYLNSGDTTKRFHIERKDKEYLKLIIINPDYSFINYTVLPNEQIREVCFKLGIPEYKLIEINANVEDFTDLKVGQQIQIPNFFVKRIVLYIREADFVPMRVKLYDDLGLYSEYEYLEFNGHPYTNNQTFNSENPAYTF